MAPPPGTSTAAAQITFGTTYTHIAAGAYHSLALDADDNLWHGTGTTTARSATAPPPATSPHPHRSPPAPPTPPSAAATTIRSPSMGTATSGPGATTTTGRSATAPPPVMSPHPRRSPPAPPTPTSPPATTTPSPWMATATSPPGILRIRAARQRRPHRQRHRTSPTRGHNGHHQHCVRRCGWHRPATPQRNPGPRHHTAGHPRRGHHHHPLQLQRRRQARPDPRPALHLHRSHAHADSHAYPYPIPPAPDPPRDPVMAPVAGAIPPARPPPARRRLSPFSQRT